MHLSTAVFAAIIGMIGATTTQWSNPVAESGCGHPVDLIIQACLASQTPLMKLCAVQDWQCLCNAASSISSCYNNCLSDPNAFGAKQTEVSYCNAAKAYPSSTSSSGKWKAAARQPTSPTTSSTQVKSSARDSHITTDPVMLITPAKTTPGKHDSTRDIPAASSVHALDGHFHHVENGAATTHIAAVSGVSLLVAAALVRLALL